MSLNGVLLSIFRCFS